MTNNVMFDRKAIEAEVVQLQALVDSIKEKRGSAAVRTRNATLQALGETVDFEWDNMPKFSTEIIPLDQSGDNVRVGLGDIAQYVANVTEWAEQLRDEVVTSILKSNGQSDNVAALKEQYVAKRTLIEAMVTLCQAQGIAVDDIKIPSVGGGRPPGSTNVMKSKGTSSKFARYFRIIDDEKKYQADSQNTLSSFAYYHGHKVMQCDPHVSTADFTKWLNDHGVDSPMGKPWSIEVENVTYGMETTDNNDTPEVSEEE